MFFQPECDFFIYCKTRAGDLGKRVFEHQSGCCSDFAHIRRAHIQTGYHHRSAVGPFEEVRHQAAQRIAQSRFAGGVSSDQADEFTLLDRKS